METEKLITIERLCDHYKIETSFIHALHEYGLIEITRIDEVECVEKDSLNDLERMANLHYELHINMEGIDAISHLLKRVETMQKEMMALRNKLGMH